MPWVNLSYFTFSTLYLASEHYVILPFKENLFHLTVKIIQI